MSKFPKVLGIGGNAGVGKDTLGRILKTLLPNSETFSLAFSLRKETEKILKKFNHNVWTQNRSAKSEFRMFLVEYAELARKATHGQYFWKKLNKEIKKNHSYLDYAIVTDVRFDEYDRDEVFWVKNNGELIYLSAEDRNKQMVGPANYKEQQNGPRLAAKHDHHLHWQLTYPVLSDEEIYLKNETAIDKLVANCIIKTK